MTDPDIKAIQDRVLKIIIGPRKVDPATITAKTTLEELGVESLDAVSIVFDIEAEFNVTIPDSQVYNLNTVGDVFATVERLVAAQKGSVAP